jgi:hypothetical protein
MALVPMSTPTTQVDVLDISPTLIVAIRFPEDSSCTQLDPQGYCNCNVRTGGDVIQGAVLLSASPKTKVTIDVRLEGRVTWLCIL